ncbi:hypothetical protein K0U83_12140, partial [bacterium]|nr:hypothetical protein [bacterium]
AEADLLRKLTVESPTVVAERLAEADKAAPILATKPVIKASGKGNKAAPGGVDKSSDEYSVYDGSLRGSIPDAAARHAKVVELMETRQERAEARKLRRQAN